MNDNAPSIKIRMIKSSLECFVFGLLGLLPIIGISFAIAALVISAKVHAGQKRFWNPARPYQLWGVVCAALSLVFWSFILMVIIYQAVNNGR